MMYNAKKSILLDTQCILNKSEYERALAKLFNHHRCEARRYGTDW